MTEQLLLQRRLVRTLFCAALLLVLLAGCAGEDVPERLWLRAPGWSRATAVATSAAADPVPLALDPDGNFYMLVITAVEGEPQPVVQALNRQTEIVWQRPLGVVLSRPDRPAIMWHEGALHVYWLNNDMLYTAVLDADGNIVQPPTLLSGELAANAYEVVPDQQGNLTLWFAGPRRDPGLYLLAPATADAQPVLVDPEAIRPSARLDENGTLHVLWARNPSGFATTELLYAAYENREFVPNQETAVAELRLGTSTVLEGPWLGIDDENAYVMWTESVRTGMEAGSVNTLYTTFPLGEPQQAGGGQPLLAPATADLNYEPYPQGAFAVGPRVLSDPALPAANDVGDLAAADTAVSEVGVALTVPVQHDFRKVVRQIETLFLNSGVITSAQLLSYTTATSQTPFLAHDADLHLYVTWLERSDAGFTVFFASTAPDVVAALSSLRAADVSRLAGEILFGILSGVVLTPLVAFVWLIAPLAVFGLTGFLRRRGEESVGAYLSLGAAIVLYLGTKLLTLPGLRQYVPFSAWIPFMPVWLQATLQILVPVAITLVSLAIAWYVIYRRGSKSALYFLLAFAGLDALLTMAIYGFLIYNTI